MAGVNYRTVIIVVVGIVVMRVTYDFASDRIVTVPTVRVTAIPVITGITVIQGPVSAQADKDVSSVIIRIEVPIRIVRPPAIVQHEMIPRPGCSAVYLVMVVDVYMLAVLNIVYNMASFTVPPAGRPFSPAVHSILAGHPSFLLKSGGSGLSINSPVFSYDVLAPFFRRSGV
jgi:hypothetical protein